MPAADWTEEEKTANGRDEGREREGEGRKEKRDSRTQTVRAID